MFLLTIYLPCLLHMFPYSYWALICLAILPTYTAFMISVRQASDLPPASFRFPVTRDTLALGYILPAVGRIRDFHPLKHAPAGRTTKNRGLIQAPGQMAYMDVYGSSTSSCIGAQQKTAVRPGHITCPGVQHSTTPHTVFGLCIESVIHVCASFTLIDVIISPFTYCVNRFLKKFSSCSIRSVSGVP